jgi:hypothetical protein
LPVSSWSPGRQSLLIRFSSISLYLLHRDIFISRLPAFSLPALTDARFRRISTVPGARWRTHPPAIATSITDRYMYSSTISKPLSDQDGPSSNRTEPGCGLFRNQIARAGLLVMALGATALLGTGCSSTGPQFGARLISPVPNDQPGVNSEDGGRYHPRRSPGFDPDLCG